MISYEWSLGNVYGDHVAPGYNAISYSWGRYDLQYMPDVGKDTLRKTRAINIGGIPWADAVPRIHPSHFSKKELKHVINQKLRLSSSNNPEFVWLDVACID